MSQLTLHGHPWSTRTQRVMVTLYELNLDFNFSLIDLMKGEHKARPSFLAHSQSSPDPSQTPSFISKHPFGLVPCLTDGPLTLFESGAMAKYIVAKYGAADSSLHEPRDLQDMALYEQAMSVEEFYFDKNVTAVATEKMFKSMFSPDPPDEKAIEASRGKVVECLAYYEGLLEKQSFLVGEDITLVDYFAAIWIMPMINKLGFEDLFAERPQLEKWWGRIQERKAWRRLMEWTQHAGVEHYIWA
ncbi:hypothetical protein MBLNU457_g0674t1 [Dothideomycetes sp. NU457]